MPTESKITIPSVNFATNYLYPYKLIPMNTIHTVAQTKRKNCRGIKYNLTYFLSL